MTLSLSIVYYLCYNKNTDKNIRSKILNGISGLNETPPIGDIKALQGRRNEYRLRIGKYRILYEYDNNTLKINDIGSRGDIYK